MGRSCQKENIFAEFLDYIFIPVNQSNAHWALVSVSCRDQTIKYYDSLQGNNGGTLKMLHDLFLSASIHQNGSKTEDWKMEVCSDLPTQTNNFDCGVFLCQYAYCIASGQTFDVMTGNTDHLRPTMHRELSEGKLREEIRTEDQLYRGAQYGIHYQNLHNGGKKFMFSMKQRLRKNS